MKYLLQIQFDGQSVPFRISAAYRIRSRWFELSCWLYFASWYLSLPRLWARTRKTLSIAQSIVLIAAKSEMGRLCSDDQFFLIFFFHKRRQVICVVFSCWISFSWDLDDDSGLFGSIHHLVFWSKNLTAASFPLFSVYSGASTVRWFVLCISLVFPIAEIFVSYTVVWQTLVILVIAQSNMIHPWSLNIEFVIGTTPRMERFLYEMFYCHLIFLYGRLTMMIIKYNPPPNLL